MDDDLPNDATTTAAVRVGQDYFGTIDFEGDEDWIRVDLTANQGVAITIEPTDGWPNKISPYVEIFEADGNYFDYRWSDDFDVGRYFILPDEDRTLYLNANSQGSTTGGYHVTVDPGDFDPADFSGTANIGSVGATYTGTLDERGDVEWTRFDLEAGDSVAFELIFGENQYQDEYHLDLVGADGNWLDTSEIGDDEIVRYSTLTDATVYLRVEALANGAAGSYTVDVTPGATYPRPDLFTINEDETLSGNVLDANSYGEDFPRRRVEVVTINGRTDLVGTTMTLATGSTLVVNADGTFDYVPSEAFSTYGAPQPGVYTGFGGDGVEYGISIDGGPVETEHMRIEVLGIDNDDLIRGIRRRNETIEGGVGNDTLYGLDRHDTIYAGEGDDWVDSGIGDDVVEGGPGNDTIRAIGGEDLIRGGEGDDWIAAGTGNDTVTGDEGDDSLYGGYGDDSVSGGEGDDLIFGNWGADTLDGGDGADTLRGGDDDDVAGGGAGVDHVYGEAGNDTLNGGADGDTVNGGDGDDHVSGGDGDDMVIGGAGADTLDGGEGADTLAGGEGDDSLFGGAGNDLLTGRDGTDTLDGGDGDDRIAGGRGDDVLFGGAGNDLFVLATGHGFDTVLDFGDGADRLRLMDFGPDLASLDDLLTAGAITEADGDTVIDLGNGDGFTLEGVALADLTETQLMFG
ncbi:calcium-binding protein [Acuticoccus yangtzensis]|uniref:calcium-binding protein n=1 Tax=Acuticoccus yangtzensis TaxID=1443441 RepID=UPI0009496F9B|nr:calcium-binding protein [Acuticoccus yangtzensis]